MQIDKQQIRVMFLVKPATLYPIVGLQHCEASALQGRTHQGGHDRVVVDDEDRRAFGRRALMHRQLQKRFRTRARITRFELERAKKLRIVGSG